jgi:hypothetical protein
MTGAPCRAAALAAVFALLLVTAPGAARAQEPPPPPPPEPPATSTVVVSGRILARGSRQPLAGASLTVDGVAAGESDGDGRFSLSVSPGHHILQVQQPGFDPFTRTVEAAADTPPLTLRLEPRTTGPTYETVVVAAPREAPAVVLDKEEMTKTPGSFGEPFRVIESLPGVAPILWPLAIYAVRGANPGNTGFLVDGLRVPALFHFALGPGVIHPYFLEGMEFYPGGYPARHGRYVAGVVAANTGAPPNDRLRGAADVRLFDAGGILTSPVNAGRGTVAVAGRYGYPGALLNALQEEVDVQYWDYQVRADHRLGAGRLTFFAFGSYDSVQETASAMDPDTGVEGGQSGRLALSFHRLDLRWRSGLGRGRIGAALGGGFDETASPYDNDSFAARTRRLIPRLFYQRPLAPWLDWEVGADGEWAAFAVETNTPDVSLAGFLRPRDNVMAGTYTTVALRLLGGRLLINPGLRLDFYQESGARAFDLAPRLDVRVQTAEKVWLKANGGRFTQMPTFPLELPGFEGFALATLGLQSSWQGSAGVEAGLPANFTVDVTGFLQRYVLSDIRDPELGNPLLDDFLTRRDALSYGLEVMIRRPTTSRWHGWLAYTLSTALRSFEGGVVGAADWDQRHILNLVSGYRIGRWTLGGRFHLHTGRPAVIDNSTPAEFTRYPPFYQLDLRIERRFLFDTFALDLYVEAVNTTFTRQVVQLRRTAAGIVEEGYKIALPSLGVRAEF